MSTRKLSKGKFYPRKKYKSSSSRQSGSTTVVIPGITRRSGFYGRYTPGQGELKFHDIAVTDAVVAVNGTIQNTGSVNLIAQGTGESQRIGRKCVIKSINWRFELDIPAVANATGSDTVRVMFYLDKQANGVTASATDILATDNFQSFNNLANSGRFRILLDRTYVLNHSGGAGDGTTNDALPYHVSDTFFKKCNIPLEFSSTAGAITELRSNNLGVLLLGRGGVAGFNSILRLRFQDS